MLETDSSTNARDDRGPSAVARFGAMLLGLAGALVCSQPLLLLGVWLCILIPLHIGTRTSRYLGYAFSVVVVPIGIVSLLVWTILVGAPPGQPVGSDPHGGFLFASKITLRLAVFSSILQLGLVTIHRDRLAMTLHRIGLRGEGLIVVLASYSLFAELKYRMDQILTARTARGLRGTTWLGRTRDLIAMMSPVLMWTVRSAVQRADMWHQRQLLRQVARMASETEETSAAVSLGLLILSGLWFLVVLVARWGA